MDETRVIPIIEEELTADRQKVKTGSVRVQKHVEQTVKRVQSTVLHDDVEVRRVPVNRVVSVAPELRHEGDTMIIPVMEEQLVVTKQLVLKEELHVIRKRSQQQVQQDVTLDSEYADLERLDAEGRVTKTASTARSRT